MTQGIVAEIDIDGEMSPTSFYNAIDATARAAYRQANKLTLFALDRLRRLSLESVNGLRRKKKENG